MIVVVNPSNPTGGVFSRETLEKLSEISIKHDLLVIADEIDVYKRQVMHLSISVV